MKYITNILKSILQKRNMADISNSKFPETIFITFHLKSGGQFGTFYEREKIHEFAAKLSNIVEKSGLGVYDGDEFGNKECSLFIFTKNSDRLFDIIYPLLSQWDLLKGGHVIKRYGKSDESERIDF